MEYHKDRFTDHSLLIFKEKKLVAALPANITDGALHSHQGLTYGGLVFTEKLKFNAVVELFKAVLKHLDNDKVATLNIKLLPAIYSSMPNEELDYLMFLVDAKLTRRDALAVIDNSKKINFSKDRKEGYKRGVKHNLIVKEEDSFDVFWNTILVPNLKAKHHANPVHSLDEITALKQSFPKHIRQFNVYKDNVVVAGTTIFETKHVAHSQYISGNINKNELGSLDFLHHYLITKVFKDKRYFDFGISNENKGRQVNQGLQYWKEGFGARTIVQDFYSVETKNYDKLNQVFI
ncbi:GNAT family N-acetyltransferase [Olleya aquimaris]|nr:GNAT family N-acetyltransferase [Olleya aquimaris]